MTELNVEALAVHLAWDSVYDYLHGEWNYGYLDEDDPVAMRESMEQRLPRARQEAQSYADLLTGTRTSWLVPELANVVKGETDE